MTLTNPMTTTQPRTTPTGYKQTPIGIIPIDWEVKRLDEIANRGTGHTPDKNNESYYNGGIKWISLADSDQLDQLYINKTKIEISSEGIRKSSAVLHPKGTVVLSRDAGVGKSSIMGYEMAVSQHFVTWTCGSELNNIFLFYKLQELKPLFERIAVGSTIKTIGLPFFKKLAIPLPPLAEQRRIAEVLQTWDTAIEKTSQLVSALQTRHRGLLQQLLTGQKRLPGFEGEWKEVRLGEVFERVNRKNTKGNTNVLTISAQAGLISQTEFYNKSVASEDVTGYYLLHKGEFAYNKSYSAGYPLGAIKRLDLYDKGILSPLYICLRLKEGFSDFFPHFFEAGRLNHGIYKIAQEGARNHGLLNISVTDFFDIKINLPTLAEQTAIAAVLDASLAEVRLQEARLRALREQKRGLMQRLLTGQVRVV